MIHYNVSLEVTWQPLSAILNKNLAVLNIRSYSSFFWMQFIGVGLEVISSLCFPLPGKNAPGKEGCLR